MDKLNLSGLFEAVPVEKELPPIRSNTLSIPVGVCNQFGPSSRGVYDYENNRWLCYGTLEHPTHWLRPVTRESIEAFMREVITGGHVKLITEMAIIAATKETNVIDVDAGVSVSEKLVSNLITELINKTLGQ